uniref:CSON002381 protein n=1 Tax=Culicoides sonorensis TaxID=179676 RepID=A0A336LJ45_CULSO
MSKRIEPPLISRHEMCRICRCYTDSLIALKCNCQGTMGYAHNSCLIKWTRVTGTDLCEVCKGSYKCYSRNYKKLFFALFSRPYFQTIMRKVIACGLIAPLLYTNTKDIITASNTVNISLGIYHDTFLSSVLMFKAILLYEFSTWSSKMLGDVKMIMNHWWNNNWSDDNIDGNITSAENSYESIQIGFYDIDDRTRIF